MLVDVTASHPCLAVVVLIADADMGDPMSNTTARSVPNKTYKVFVSMEKRIFFLLFASLAIVSVPLATREQHRAFFFVPIGTLPKILRSSWQPLS
jgi:hypothetical protein